MAKRRDVVGADPGTGITGWEVASGADGVIAIYFKLSERPVARTVEFDPDVLVDLDKNREVVGLELLNPMVVNLKTILKKVGKKFKSEKVQEFEGANSKRLEKLQELIEV